MNYQNEGGIDYLDATCNIVTGCYMGCTYCWARDFATRFRPQGYDGSHSKMLFNESLQVQLCEMDGGPPFPHGFMPTFYHHRLTEPQKDRAPQRIGMCFAGELFGQWVPRQWQYDAFDAAARASWHRYLWLSKCPDIMNRAWNRWRVLREDIAELQRWWFGCSITRDIDLMRLDLLPYRSPGVAGLWASFEPLLGPIPVDKIRFASIDFAVIGPRAGSKPNQAVIDWAGELIERLDQLEMPVWTKGWLRDVFKRTELPHGLELAVVA